MENAADSGESDRICFQTDLKIILDGTKKMMELMEIEKDKITELEQGIAKNIDSLLSTRNFIKNFKEFINKNLADIGNRTNFSNIFEECKTNIISSAQILYKIVMDLNYAISSAEATISELVDIANDNEQVYNLEVQCYKHKEKQLVTELEKMKQIHILDTNAKEALAKENICLKLELEQLNLEVDSYEQKLMDIPRFAENNIEQNQVLDKLIEECNWYDNEILGLTRSLDSIISQNKENEVNVSTNIVICKTKIDELEKELQHVVEELKQLKTNEKNSNYEISTYKDSIKNSEINLVTLSSKYEELNEMTKGAQESFDEEMLSYKETLSKKEYLMKCNQEIGLKLSQKIEARKVEIEHFNTEINMFEDILTGLVEKDIYKQIEVKQDNLHELNLELEKAKDTYKQCLLEKQEFLQAKIIENEKENSILSNYTTTVETELKELQDKIKHLKEEKPQCQKILSDLKSQYEKKRVGKTEVQPKKRRWDSDSTIDDENWIC
ncbi:myosin-11-like isoform X1 [Diorhabda sublineata]|uniref:myosin-11-like isoform X1 n=2 Tax=Diorhabda sublineata TaxID=1163346 RepID=UPI0024E07746|nr:myosin-11-like isoform X1 [Diorhabda sublineata]